MAKIKLCAEPTFKAVVPIPIAGSGTTPVEFTFKHRTRQAIVEWVASIKDAIDADAVEGCITAWELDDELTHDNIVTLCDNYAGAGFAIVTTYLDELRGAREKN